MTKEKPCGSCLGCERGRGCEEHHRRCADWPRNMHAHHAGSSITGVSSQFDLAAADLSKYEAVLEQLRETDIEMEEAVDALAAGSTSRTNPRYDATLQELASWTMKSITSAKLSGMLRRHAEVSERLQELQGEDGGAHRDSDYIRPGTFWKLRTGASDHRRRVVSPPLKRHASAYWNVQSGSPANGQVN